MDSALLKLLQDSQGCVRKGAAEAVGQLGERVFPDLRDDLLSLLEGQEDYVRARAVKAVGRLGVGHRSRCGTACSHC